MHSPTLRRAAARTAVAAGISAGLLLPSIGATAALADQASNEATAPPTAQGYAGACTDDLGVTVVVDDRDLQADGSQTGGIETRCAPTQTAGQPFSGTGLDAWQAAGFSGSEPPTGASWGYWYAADGGDWTASAQGAADRQAVAGGFEGWSFSHDATTTPQPGVDPTRPEASAEATAEATATTEDSPTEVAADDKTTDETSTDEAAADEQAADVRAKATRAEANPADAVRTADAGSAKSASASVREPALTAGWLRDEFGPDGLMPGFSPDSPDIGLTVDALWAMQAGGASEAELEETWDALRTRTDDFAGPFTSEFTPGQTYYFGGGTAKMLLAAETMGVDPTRIDAGLEQPMDLLSQMLELVAVDDGAGYGKGQVVDDYGTGDLYAANLFAQSLAVMGLSLADLDENQHGTAQSAVDYLIRQQCTDGWFPMFPTAQSCNEAFAADQASPDNDGAAMGVQALLAADEAGYDVPESAIDRGVQFLLDAQQTDGSFGGGVITEAPNANSTGLVAATLQAAGKSAEAAKAGDWVAELQARPDTVSGTSLATDLGAIAYKPDDFKTAKEDGIGDIGRDTWRRTSAQAIFALNPVSFTSLATAEAGPGLPTTTPPKPPTKPTTKPTTPPTTPATKPTTKPATSPSSPTRSTPSAADRAQAAAERRAQAAAERGSARVPRERTPRVRTPRTKAEGDFATPLAMPTTAVPTPVIPDWSTQDAGAQVDQARDVALSAPAEDGPSIPPLVWALVVGALFGGLVILRPWQYLGRGTH